MLVVSYIGKDFAMRNTEAIEYAPRPGEEMGSGVRSGAEDLSPGHVEQTEDFSSGR
jgi:hypothetical protein